MRYKYYVTPDKHIICTTTFAGKTLRAEAKCAPDDDYDELRGKQIARAKVDIKVGKKRLSRATAKLGMADSLVDEAVKYQSKMERYYDDAREQLNGYYNTLSDLIKGKFVDTSETDGLFRS